MRFEYELVVVHVDDLLGDVDVRERHHLAEQQHLALPHLEHQPRLQSSAQENITYQRPVLHCNTALLLTLQIIN